MMTKTDIHLLYQQETGRQLATIQSEATHKDPNTQDYIDWLEEKLASLTILEALGKELI